MSNSFLLIQVSDRECTAHTAKPPYIVGPFAAEEDAVSFAVEHGMGQGHDEYGGRLSVCVVANSLTVCAPAEAAADLAMYADEAL